MLEAVDKGRQCTRASDLNLVSQILSINGHKSSAGVVRTQKPIQAPSQPNKSKYFILLVLQALSISSFHAPLYDVPSQAR
jgi:hypothetical protein